MPTPVPATITARTMAMWTKYMKLTSDELAFIHLSTGKGKATTGSDQDEDDDARDERYDTQYFSEPESPKKETDVSEVWFSGCHCGT